MTRRVDERTDARERALILLYEAESKRLPPLEVLGAQAPEGLVHSERDA